MWPWQNTLQGAVAEGEEQQPRCRLQERRTQQAPTVPTAASSTESGSALPTVAWFHHGASHGAGQQLWPFTSRYPDSAPAELLELIVRIIWSQESK